MKIAKFYGLNELHESQKLAINTVLTGGDLFLSTKTGSGKSLPYQAIPVISRLRPDSNPHTHDTGPGSTINQQKCQTSPKWLVLVVAPLISIMREQTQRLDKAGVKAGYIGQTEHQCPEDVFSQSEVVFGTPEALLQTDKWRDVLKTEDVLKRLKLVVVDEAHTVHQW